jgi:hypothetical protein
MILFQFREWSRSKMQFSVRSRCRQTLFENFIFCWPCISLQILTNNQFDVLFHVFIYFMSLHVSSITVLIIRISNCINTSYSMISLCDCLVCRSGVSLSTGIPSSHLLRLIIPDDVLKQLDLLMMSTVMLETCRHEINKYMKKCVKLVISKNYLRVRQTDTKTPRKIKTFFHEIMCGIGVISSHFYPRHYMEMSGQFQDPAALSPL